MKTLDGKDIDPFPREIFPTRPIDIGVILINSPTFPIEDTVHTVHTVNFYVLEQEFKDWIKLPDNKQILINFLKETITHLYIIREVELCGYHFISFRGFKV